MAAFALLAAAVMAPSTRAADAPSAATVDTHALAHAGETARTAHVASAAVRNHGNDAVRVLVWYPADVHAAERPAEIGDPGHAVFVAGDVAADALWADAARHPVVLLSHGFGGAVRQMTWLGAALARDGYVAVAVDHPGTNGVDGITPQGAYAPWERTSDLIAALDLVLADPALRSHLDATRVGVAGFSLGGFTTALMAGARPDLAHFEAFCTGPARDAICDKQVEFPLDFVHDAAKTLAEPAMAPLAARARQPFGDPRIKSAFLIAPALGEALDATSLAHITIPVTVLYGDADPVVPPATNGALIAHAIPHAKAIVLPRVRHYDFLSDCGPTGLKVAAAYCTDGTDTHRAETHATTIAAVIAFFDETLRR